MKLRRDSFARRLTPEKRDELFTKLAGGMTATEAGKKVCEWSNPPRLSAPSNTAIDSWFDRERAARGIKAAALTAIVAEADSPKDVDEKTRRLIGQRKFQSVLDGEAGPQDLASYERNDIAKQKLELDERKFEYATWVAERNVILDRTRLLLLRVRGGDRSADMQKMIDLVIQQIDQMMNGGVAS